MALLDDLAAGTLGLVVVPPHGLSAKEQTKTSVTFSDPEPGVRWWFYFFPDLPLDLSVEHMPSLRLDVERHTRLLFESMFSADASGLNLPSDLRPRTDDPTWTPVIEVQRSEVPGGAALTVLHRMHYQPTRESVMGHTLVPVEGGLFEARWLCMASMTGYRESVLMLKLDENGDGGFQPQAVYDDPQYDATFPQHPLSIARAGKQWYADGALKVTRRPRTRSAGEVMLDPLGCAIVAPPRFQREGMTSRDGDVSCVLARVSFCGTDGVDRLVITRSNERIRGIAVAHRLARFARARSRSLCEESGLTNVTCEATPLETARASVLVVTEGETGQVGSGRARTAWRWFVGDDGRVWSIAIVTTVAVPVQELTDTVAAVTASWRT